MNGSSFTGSEWCRVVTGRKMAALKHMYWSSSPRLLPAPLPACSTPSSLQVQDQPCLPQSFWSKIVALLSDRSQWSCSVETSPTPFVKGGFLENLGRSGGQEESFLWKGKKPSGGG